MRVCPPISDADILRRAHTPFIYHW
jgi:hypothetical protein